MRLSYMATKLKTKETVEKNLFFKFDSKIFKTNSYELKSLRRFCVTRLGEAVETYRYQVYGVQQQQKRQTQVKTK